MEEQKICANPRCEKVVEAVEGKRQKIYCSDACRASVWSKNNPKREPKWVKFSDFEELKKKYDNLIESKFMDAGPPKLLEGATQSITNHAIFIPKSTTNKPLPSKQEDNTKDEGLPQKEEGHRNEAKMLDLENELKLLGKGTFADMRRQTIQKQLHILKKQNHA